MFCRICLSTIIIILLSSLLLAQTTVPGGYVSGTWTSAGSPYNVQGNITIHADSTLNIEPDVTVDFQGSYSLTVNGFLEAIGTEADSIYFFGINWGGIDFSGAPDSSHLSYCIVTGCFNGTAAIYCNSSNPVLMHCTVRNNYTAFGGIYLSGSNALIAHCTIHDNDGFLYRCGITLENSIADISFCNITGHGNSPNEDGSGIYFLFGSTAHISHCTITGNISNSGGGIYVGGSSSAVISNCTIDNNIAYSGGGIAFVNSNRGTIINCTINADSAAGGSSGKGGGIYISSPNGIFTIDNSTISNCHITERGSGIHIDNADSVLINDCIIDRNRNYLHEGAAIYSVNCGSLVIDHCDFVRNHCYWIVSGIWLNGNTNLTLSNSIFRGQEEGDIWFVNYSSATVTYCDFYGATWQTFVLPPPGLGTLAQTNANGDSCDIFYNIYLDPLLVDFNNGNYHLTEDSPCIDAGDPMSPNDPDGTVTDMGRYYFDQSTPTVPSAIADLTISRDALYAYLTWSPVTTDTSGNPITVSRYVIYASESAFFEPVAGDSIGYVVPPDTAFTDINALLNMKRFYNVKAKTDN